MSQMTITAFDEKASELDRLKRDAVLHMRKVNALKLEYMASKRLEITSYMIHCMLCT